MRVGILGPLEVADDQGRQLVLGGRKQRSVLAILLLHRGELVSTERLIDELWGERAPVRATKTVQVYVSNLRKALGDGVLVTRAGGYAFVGERVDLDVDRFEALADTGRRALTDDDPRRAQELLFEALCLWRGPALADFAYEPFAQREIARLQDARLAAVEDRIEAELRLGADAALVGEIEALVGEQPLRERLCGQLMLALYRAGRQADALAAYRRAREYLSTELGLEPGPQLRALEVAILNQDPSLNRAAVAGPAPRASGSDPAVSSAHASGGELPPRGVRVIGRQRELDELAALIADPGTPLVTLTGTGGIGKTTLALEAARAAAPRFADGVRVAWLAPMVDGRQVVTEIARVLGIDLSAQEPALEAVVRALRAQRLLLVLDNFEHVADSAPAIGQLVARCPQLKLLVTSRIRLRVALERVYRVEPLALPDPGEDASPDALRRSAAGALFIERVTAADPTFAISDRDAAAVAELCRYLGGLPLALELAAARAAILPAAAILERLRDAGEKLGPARRDAPVRQRTLEATIDWSVRLISPGEQTLFARLAVFSSGFTVESAESVCADLELSAVDGLAALLDHGLVQLVPARHGARLAMLEPIRAYALGLLRAESTGYEAALRRFGEHLATFAENAQAGLDSGGQLQWLNRLDDEQANLRAIIHGASDDRQLTCALRIAGALSRYWHLRDLAPELVAWLTRALARPAARSKTRARALYALGVTSAAIGKRRAATLALRECLSMSGEHVDARLAALCESLLAVCLDHQGSRADAAVHRAEALAAATAAKDLVTRATVCLNLGSWSPLRNYGDRELIAEALTLYQSLGDRVGVCRAHHALGWWAMLAGDPEIARVNLEEALLAAGGVCAAGLTAEIRGHLGLLELVEGRSAPARAHLSAAVAVLSRSGDVEGAREALFGLAALAVSEGAPERSSRLVAAAELLHSGPPTPAEYLLYRSYLREVRAHPSDRPAGRGLGVAAADLAATLSEVSREASTVTQQALLTLQRSTAFPAKLASSA
jgi:predicted ATPase/DNA-binding SARP family transcriptional activator